MRLFTPIVIVATSFFLMLQHYSLKFFLLLETFEAEVNGVVSFKFNFLVLNLSLFCLYVVYLTNVFL